MTVEQQIVKELKENSARLTILIGLEMQTQKALKRIGKTLKQILGHAENTDDIVTALEFDRVKKIVTPLIDRLPPFPLAH